MVGAGLGGISLLVSCASAAFSRAGVPAPSALEESRFGRGGGARLAGGAAAEVVRARAVASAQSVMSEQTSMLEMDGATLKCMSDPLDGSVNPFNLDSPDALWNYKCTSTGKLRWKGAQSQPVDVSTWGDVAGVDASKSGTVKGAFGVGKSGMIPNYGTSPFGTLSPLGWVRVNHHTVVTQAVVVAKAADQAAEHAAEEAREAVAPPVAPEAPPDPAPAWEAAFAPSPPPTATPGAAPLTARTPGAPPTVAPGAAHMPSPSFVPPYGVSADGGGDTVSTAMPKPKPSFVPPFGDNGHASRTAQASGVAPKGKLVIPHYPKGMSTGSSYNAAGIGIIPKPVRVDPSIFKKGMLIQPLTTTVNGKANAIHEHSAGAVKALQDAVIKSDGGGVNTPKTGIAHDLNKQLGIDSGWMR